jgi:hypothetical protein
MNFLSGWTLANTGTLNFFGGPDLPTAATIDGLSQTINGTINVDQIACVLAPTIFGPSAIINLPDPEDQLIFHYDFTLPTSVTVNGAGSIGNAIPSSLTIPNGSTLNYGVANHGTLHIGTSRDVATVASFTQADTGHTRIDIRALKRLGSPTPDPPVAGRDYDQLTVTGPVTLAGTLDLLPNFMFADPLLGFEYPILIYEARTGMFDAITGTAIPGTTDIALAPIFTDPTEDPTSDTALTPGTLTLLVATPGDANLDGKVSSADFLAWQRGFGTTPSLYNETLQLNSWQLGDFNTDGQITTADLSLLALNFGFDPTTPIGLSLTTAATLAGIPRTAIPEPSTSVILLLLATAMGTARHRPRRRRLGHLSNVRSLLHIGSPRSPQLPPSGLCLAVRSNATSRSKLCCRVR